MGTNYYWRHNICTCCGRYAEWHICKSLISFQGHFGEETWNEAKLSYDSGPALAASWQQWKGLIRSDGEVWDEYGRQHAIETFIADVEATTPVARRRQYQWCADHTRHIGVGHLDKVGEHGEWLDADGFSFHGGEFS